VTLISKINGLDSKWMPFVAREDPKFEAAPGNLVPDGDPSIEFPEQQTSNRIDLTCLVEVSLEEAFETPE